MDVLSRYCFVSKAEKRLSIYFGCLAYTCRGFFWSRNLYPTVNVFSLIRAMYKHVTPAIPLFLTYTTVGQNQAPYF